MSDFKAKMQQNPKFGWGSAPDPAEELRALPRPTSKGRGREGRGRGAEGRGGERCGVQKILKIDPERNSKRSSAGA